MEPIGAIADLPIARRELADLLHLRDERVDINWDYTGFGYARGTVWLEDGRGGQQRVDDALILALHNMEDGEALAGDIELEFCIDEVHPGYSVSVLLSAFLAEWLPRIRGDERAIVLALCNPGSARPRVAAGVPVHVALGKVAAWQEGRRVLLAADTWLRAD